MKITKVNSEKGGTKICQTPSKITMTVESMDKITRDNLVEEIMKMFAGNHLSIKDAKRVLMDINRKLEEQKITYEDNSQISTELDSLLRESYKYTARNVSNELRKVGLKK